MAVASAAAVAITIVAVAELANDWMSSARTIAVARCSGGSARMVGFVNGFCRAGSFSASALPSSRAGFDPSNTIPRPPGLSNETRQLAIRRIKPQIAARPTRR